MGEVRLSGTGKATAACLFGGSQNRWSPENIAQSWIDHAKTHPEDMKKHIVNLLQDFNEKAREVRLQKETIARLTSDVHAITAERDKLLGVKRDRAK